MMWWLTQHLIIAAALTAIIFAITRWRRIRPTVAHALWLLVLIKLLVPPLVVWPWTPLPAAVVEAPIYEMPATTTGVEITSLEVPDNFLELAPPTVVTTAAPISFTTAALAVWLTGAVVVVCWRSLQGFRLWRMVRRGSPAPVGLQQEAEDAAVRSGIAPLQIRLVPGLATPGIWCTVRPILLWPCDLAPALTPQGLRSVLLHELAHVRRRDYVTAWLVLLGEIIWWWNPCFWITRRLLHENAELACDAWVTTVLPESRRDYAEALLAFAAPPSQYFTLQPALGLHSTLKKTFTRRLTMIMEETRHPRHMSRWGICAIVLFGLAILPAWSRGEDDPQAEPPTIYIDRHGHMIENREADYIYLASEPNSDEPKRLIHIVADINTDETVVMQAIKDLQHKGFPREQLLVRRNRGGLPPLKTFSTTRIYPVGDIVVPLDTRASIERARASGHKNPYELLKQSEIDEGLNSLSNLIKMTVSYDSWHSVGGPGRISIDNTKMSLVIYEYNYAHDEIAELLDQLRRLQLKNAEDYLSDVQNSEPLFSERTSSTLKPHTKTQESAFIAVTYSIADLINDVPRNVNRKIIATTTQAPQETKARLDLLSDVIVETTGITNWEVGGGSGRISEFTTTLSLVICHTGEMHQRVADLLIAMRKANFGRSIAKGDENAIRTFARNYRAAQAE